jgi:hypothetical protein
MLPDFRLRQRDYLLEISRAITGARSVVMYRPSRRRLLAGAG